MTDVGYLVQCPYCRCASSLSMYVDKAGEIRLDHDCPSCGHRGLSAWDVVVSCLGGIAASYFARPGAASYYERPGAASPDLPATALADDLRESMDIEPMYRTPSGVWYGLRSKRRLHVAPTPEGECDLFDPRYDHIGDTSWQEGCE